MKHWWHKVTLWVWTYKEFNDRETEPFHWWYWFYAMWVCLWPTVINDWRDYEQDGQ